MDNDTGPPDTHAPTGPTNAQPTAQQQVFAHATNVTVNALPLPIPNTPETRAARDLNAVGQIAALIPVNPAELMAAVQFVTAGAQALECQRLAQGLAMETATPILRMAATMARVSQAAANTLLRLQDARAKREAEPARAATAAMVEHGSLQLMTAALAQRAADERAAAERAEVARAEAEAARQALPPEPEPPPITEADIAAAEAYAQSNRTNLNRARILRRKGGFPNWGMFTPPEDNVIRAIAFGHSPFLDTLLP